MRYEVERKGQIIRVIAMIFLILLVALATSGCGSDIADSEYVSGNNIEQLDWNVDYKVLDVREVCSKEGLYFYNKVIVILEDSNGERIFITHGFSTLSSTDTNSETYMSFAKLVPGDIVERNGVNNNILDIVKRETNNVSLLTTED